MSQSISPDALNQLFLDARSHNGWLDQPVEEKLLEEAWNLARWAPTSMNCCPARIHFIKSDEAKEKLKACLSEGNIEKTMKAPVCAIIATDYQFFTNLPRLYPNFPGAADMFDMAPDLAEETAFRNSSLQGAYFILACRAMGLDCGPMSGFDNKKLDETFFSGSKLKSNFLCNIGYGDKADLDERNPRPAFDEVCKII